MLQEDKRARKLLVDMHWTSSGWRSQRLQPARADSEYGIAAGYLFEPVAFGHDDLIRKIKAAATTVSLADAAGAYVASLTGRQLFLRPFLTSVVLARSMPLHRYEPGRDRPFCRVCGHPKAVRNEDLNVLNFERHKWGGVRHLDPLFIWFCLNRLAAEGGAQSTDDGRAAFTSLLESFRSLPAGTSATRAESALRFLPSNKAERHTMIQQLSIVGVLQNPSHPGFLGAFVAFDDRDLPNLPNMDRGYPAQWWNSDHGLNEGALAELFGA